MKVRRMQGPGKGPSRRAWRRALDGYIDALDVQLGGEAARQRRSAQEAEACRFVNDVAAPALESVASHVLRRRRHAALSFLYDKGGALRGTHLLLRLDGLGRRVMGYEAWVEDGRVRIAATYQRRRLASELDGREALQLRREDLEADVVALLVRSEPAAREASR